jgi:propanol-preferring alcohol dehydrogenase
MQAIQITTWHEEAQLVELPDPTPGPGQIVLKIGGAGACHSDLHMMHGAKGTPSPLPLPFVLGHENAGWVHALGEGVTSFELGQAVAVYGAWGCGACARCLNGLENYCEGQSGIGVGPGLGIDGGMAEFMVVPDARYLVALPENLSPAEAAPLTDAGLTPYHAVARSLAKLGPTSTAVVIGVGGLGHMAVQILKALSAARVIVLDTKRQALELGLACGADQAIEAGDGAAAEVRAATNGLGADVVLDFVGSDETLAMAARSMRALGDLTLVGVAGGSLDFAFLKIPYEVSVQSVYWGTRAELAEVLELAARGLITPTSTTYALADAPKAYRDLEAGSVAGRAVIVP